MRVWIFFVFLLACGREGVGSGGTSQLPQGTAPAATSAPNANPSPTPQPSPASSPEPDPILPPDPVPEPQPPPLVQDGSWAHPWYASTLPATFTGDTRSEGQSVAATYACAADKPEGGNEILYAFDAPSDGVITAALDDVSGDAFDVDVHLLSALDAGACISRNDKSVSAAVQANMRYYIAVDSYGATPKPGPFTLTLTFQPLSTDNGTCPSDMVVVPAPSGAVCMDRFEAPNVIGEQPFVMFTFPESVAWCAARGKRLCYNDEWEHACAGDAGRTYVWGNSLGDSTCNNEKTWRTYSDTLMGKWPSTTNKPTLSSRAEQFATAAMTSAAGAEAAAHVESLYQAEGAGAYPGCVDEWGVYDLTGSVEEWTQRRDGGTPGYHGSLKGRYWADTRTCQGNITTHADAFRFYEIGFRCCKDP